MSLRIDACRLRLVLISMIVLFLNVFVLFFFFSIKNSYHVQTIITASAFIFTRPRVSLVETELSNREISIRSAHPFI